MRRRRRDVGGTLAGIAVLLMFAVIVGYVYAIGNGLLP
jgi:hypothetical protein